MAKEIKSSKLVSLEDKIAQLQAQHAAEKAKIKAKVKKDDTRRKILVGAYILEKAEKEGTKKELIKEIDPFLTRAGDRELFGLKKIQKNPTKEST